MKSKHDSSPPLEPAPKSSWENKKQDPYRTPGNWDVSVAGDGDSSSYLEAVEKRLELFGSTKDAVVTDRAIEDYVRENPVDRVELLTVNREALHEFLDEYSKLLRFRNFAEKRADRLEDFIYRFSNYEKGQDREQLASDFYSSQKVGDLNEMLQVLKKDKKAFHKFARKQRNYDFYHATRAADNSELYDKANELVEKIMVAHKNVVEKLAYKIASEVDVPDEERGVVAQGLAELGEAMPDLKERHINPYRIEVACNASILEKDKQELISRAAKLYDERADLLECMYGVEIMSSVRSSDTEGFALQYYNLEADYLAETYGVGDIDSYFDCDETQFILFGEYNSPGAKKLGKEEWGRHHKRSTTDSKYRNHLWAAFEWKPVDYSSRLENYNRDIKKIEAELYAMALHAAGE